MLRWFAAGKGEKIAVKTAEPSNITLTGASPLVTTGTPSRTVPNQSVCATLYIQSREDDIKGAKNTGNANVLQGGLSAICFCRYAAKHVIKI